MIDSKDLVIEEDFFMRSDQPSCSVTVTHLPTGVQISVQKERRSRESLKKEAIERLEAIVRIDDPMPALLVDLEILISEWLNEEGTCPNSPCSNPCFEVDTVLKRCAYELEDVVSKYQG